MRNIKSDKANLEKKRGLFFQIGLIIAFSILLFAFEWGSDIGKANSGYQLAGIDLETEMTPITRQKELKPPPPKQFKEFKIVENDVIIEKPLVIELIEIDPGEGYFVPEMINPVEIDDEPKIWAITEEEPVFPGGLKGLQYYLAKNTKYPNQAIENDMQGKVYVRFVINEKGEVENAHIVRPVYPILDKEALKVVNSLPDWKPGKQGGKAVKVWFTVPIVFVLR